MNLSRPHTMIVCNRSVLETYSPWLTFNFEAMHIRILDLVISMHAGTNLDV